MAFADTRPRECIDHTQGHYWSICWFTPYRAQRVYHQIPSPTLLVNLPIHSLGGVLITNTIPRSITQSTPLWVYRHYCAICKIDKYHPKAHYWSILSSGPIIILKMEKRLFSLTMMSPTMNRTTMRIMIMILMLLTLITMQSICFGMIERSQVGSDVRPWRIPASSPDCQYWSTPRWWWWCL